MFTIPTTEDRIWAAVAHLSSLAFGMGIVLPIVSWSDRRRKSNYASFQSLQALGYQSLGFTIWVLSYLVVIIAMILLLAILSAVSGGNWSTIPSAWLTIFFIVVFGFFALYFLLPIIAAIACALGKDFRYPVMGNRLARYLVYDPLQITDGQVWLAEDHEFRWVAAAGHFSVLIMLWGMLAPLAAWILRGRYNFFLKFQSIQTIVYQACVTVLYAVGGSLYGMGLLVLIASTGGIGQSGGNSSFGIVGVVISGAVLLLGTVIILVIPLLHILGQWAGYRVLKGENYRYPLVGRLVEKRISKRFGEEKSA
jgi:uncharacterized Tic20 family protein